MDLYTVQMSKGRNDPDLLDITVKGWSPLGRVFAPTWDMVMAHKRDKNDAVYTEQYHDMMVKSYYANQDKWLWVLAQPRIVLACFCRAGDFCHRKLLAQYLTHLGANYKGEL